MLLRGHHTRRRSSAALPIASVVSGIGITAQNLFVLCVVVFPLFARAQISLPDTISARSVSGQFIVTGASRPPPPAWLGHADSPPIPILSGSNPRCWPFPPSASRSRSGSRTWALTPPRRGADKFFSRCIRRNRRTKTSPSFPRPSPAAGTIASNCRMFCPAAVLPARADRRAAAGICQPRRRRASPRKFPPWLTDGLSQQLLAAARAGNHLVVAGQNRERPAGQPDRLSTQRGLDPLAGARRVLQNHPALTFEQLSWPARRAIGRRRRRRVSRQRAIVRERIAGTEKRRGAFARDARNPAAFLQLADGLSNRVPRKFSAAARRGKMVGAASRELRRARPRPRWTPAVSRDKLDEIFSVPVEMRDGVEQPCPRTRKFRCRPSSAISIPPADGDSPNQTARPRTGAIARMAPPFAVLTGAYRRALRIILARRSARSPVLRWIKHPPAAPSKTVPPTR